MSLRSPVRGATNAKELLLFSREEMLSDICKAFKDETMTFKRVTAAAIKPAYNGPLIFFVAGRGDELWTLAEKLGTRPLVCEAIVAMHTATRLRMVGSFLCLRLALLFRSYFRR